MAGSIPATLIPAATVLLLRDGDNDLEILMLRRNRALKAFSGAWVFPGGRVESSDGQPGDCDKTCARIAGCRETLEETSLTLNPEDLISLSLWIPPTQEKRRFSTHFFIAKAPNAPVIIDDGEIHDYQWIKPKTVIEKTPHSDMSIMPPTYISLLALSVFDGVDAALSHISQCEDDIFETRFMKTGTGFTTLWQPDIAYRSGDLDAEGPRHRLVVGIDKWHYQKD